MSFGAVLRISIGTVPDPYSATFVVSESSLDQPVGPGVINRTRIHPRVKHFHVPLVEIPDGAKSFSVCGNNRRASLAKCNPANQLFAPFIKETLPDETSLGQIIDNVGQSLTIEFDVFRHKI